MRRIRDSLDTQSRLKAEEQYFVARLNDDVARRVNQLIRGAMQEARTLMKERGALLVLNSRMGRVQINSDQQMQEEGVLRRVLCAAPGTDVTDDVLTRMNKWFQENQDRSGAVGAAGDVDKDGYDDVIVGAPEDCG